MDFLQYIPILELLFFNLFSIYRCCHKKYSVVKTIFVLALFSAAMFLFFLIFAEQFSFRGDGSMSLGGFLFLIAFRLLYRENFPLLFVITCTCWVYTLGILALSFQIAAVFASGSLIAALLTETLFFLLTIVPLCRHILPKYIFIIENMETFEKYWYKYIALNSILNFFTLFFLNRIFLGDGSLFRILCIVLLLVSFYASYIILYQVVLGSIQIFRLDHLTLHDDLTDLGNRTGLMNNLTALCGTERSFSLLFMDLDRFKLVNDHYGHTEGDRYLRRFADISSDILDGRGKVYRLSGDEFVALYHDGEVPAQTVAALEECRQWDLNEKIPFQGVSIGMIFCSPPHMDPEQILRQADAAMYLNKLKRKAARG